MSAKAKSFQDLAQMKADLARAKALELERLAQEQARLKREQAEKNLFVKAIENPWKSLFFIN